MEKMRCILVITLMVGMMFLLFGCSENPDQLNEGSPEEEVVVAKEEEASDIIEVKEVAAQEEKEEIVEEKERIKVDLDSQAQREINIFLSNFTEVFFEDFQSNSPTEQLINFSVLHNYINNFDAIKIDGYRGYLDKAIVSRSIHRFFGKEIEHQSTRAYDFDGRNYVIPMANGVIFPFAVVNALYDNEDGTYEVYFYEVFDYRYELGPDPYAMSPKELEEKLAADYGLELGERKKAIVTRHDFEGNNRYKLKAYTTVVPGT